MTDIVARPHPQIPSGPAAAALQQVAASEAALGVRLDYLREMAETGSPILARMQALTALNRETARASDLPADVRAFATLGAVMHDDCGECVQIHVNLDRAAGIDAGLLQAALDRRIDALPAPLALAWQFGAAVAANDPAMEELRERMEQAHGRAAIVDLAFSMAVARFYPTVKRAMGYARSCSLVQVKAA
jgi:alkylhydroperoxidase/carboxymuconolactone decarboxylase family protein YurZ